MTYRTILFLMAATLVLTAIAFADIVHLKSGGRIEGKATRTDKQVLVETLAGETRIPAGTVDRIDFDHEATIETYYVLREKADRSPHPAAYLEIAVWAQENGAGRYVAPSVEIAAGIIASEEDAGVVLALGDAFDKRLGAHLAPIWVRLLNLDPRSERARRALGYRQVNGKWVTNEEFQVAQGNVLFEDEWITPAARDLIEAERAAKFRKREKALERAEKDSDKREKALTAEKKKVDKVKRELTAQAKKQASAEKRLDKWEKDLKVREGVLSALRICRTCRQQFTGTHICPNTWIYCKTCRGYMKARHTCNR